MMKKTRERNNSTLVSSQVKALTTRSPASRHQPSETARHHDADGDKSNRGYGRQDLRKTTLIKINAKPSTPVRNSGSLGALPFIHQLSQTRLSLLILIVNLNQSGDVARN